MKQLCPFSTQRWISAITPASVNFGRYRRSDSSTLTMIVCRRAPTSVLLVRPVLRAWAGLRSVRSASLFVPATGWLAPFGCAAGLAVTKVNSCLGQHQPHHFVDQQAIIVGGPSSGGNSTNHIGPHNSTISSSRSATFRARPASLSRPSRCTRQACAVNLQQAIGELAIFRIVAAPAASA